MKKILAENQFLKNINSMRLVYEQKINKMHDCLMHNDNVGLFLRAYQNLLSLVKDSHNQNTIMCDL